MLLEKLRNLGDGIEGLLTDAVAKIAPWLAPIPTAYLVGRATIEHLEWPLAIGVVAALIVESLGLATTQTALELRGYNREKRKSDPSAPFWLSAILVSVYLMTALGLTVMLDVFPQIAAYSTGVFPLLSLCGMITLALRGDHRRRLNVIESVKQERRARRKGTVKQVSKKASKSVVDDANMTVARQGRQAKKDARLDALTTFYMTNPDAGPTEAGQSIGVARQTVYSYIDELEAAGRITRDNGQIRVQA